MSQQEIARLQDELDAAFHTETRLREVICRHASAAVHHRRVINTLRDRLFALKRTAEQVPSPQDGMAQAFQHYEAMLALVEQVRSVEIDTPEQYSAGAPCNRPADSGGTVSGAIERQADVSPRSPPAPVPPHSYKRTVFEHMGITRP